MRAHIVGEYLEADVGSPRKHDQDTTELISEGLPPTDRIAKRRIVNDEPQRALRGRGLRDIVEAFHSALRTTQHLVLCQGR
ncbi:hypothetical protein EHYA_01763 [Embleya hyalina]|uniref:Uncharacterized protein n=1 Tax=Embleya hyalina TaxID=516124 RepID=A0A401YHK3_9ACTN|nr:hypothetical protein EHYA_01763 [Embleya hyalina]